jgi:hypothetical protein
MRGGRCPISSNCLLVPLPGHFPILTGGAAVAEVRPKISRRLTSPSRPPRRTIAIRQTSGHRLAALIEIASPANKDRAESVRGFAHKVIEELYAGVHVLAADVFPPRRHDPIGSHRQIWSHFAEVPHDIPPDKPLTVSSDRADASPEAWLEHLAPGRRSARHAALPGARRMRPRPSGSNLRGSLRHGAAILARRVGGPGDGRSVMVQNRP